MNKEHRMIVSFTPMPAEQKLRLANILGFETLVTRNSGEDFQETAVWLVNQALDAAYSAGLAARS